MSLLLREPEKDSEVRSGKSLEFSEISMKEF